MIAFKGLLLLVPKVLEKVLPLTQKEEPQMNIFVVYIKNCHTALEQCTEDNYHHYHLVALLTRISLTLSLSLSLSLSISSFVFIMVHSISFQTFFLYMHLKLS